MPSPRLRPLVTKPASMSFAFWWKPGPMAFWPAIAETLGVRQNTMSSNLSILLNAGLVRSTREGRAIRYFADMERMRALLSFLLEDCCGGRPELCQPALAELACKG